jgi:hypothetical protein
MREILCVHQPCILCEGTLQVWTLFRDDLTGDERIETEDAKHECPAMGALLRERFGR